MTAEDVKAKDFFKCVRLGDAKYLNFENQDEVFKTLQDEFFLMRDNGADKNDLNTHKKIASLNHKLSLLYLAKSVYQDLPLDAERRKKIESSLKKIGFTLKENKNPKSINNQFSSFIGQIKNQIKIAELNILNKKENKGTFNYEQVIVAFESVIERPIAEDISLAKFAAYEREANIRIKKLKERNNG